MSELDDLEFDPYEYAEQLGYTDELGMHDMSDMTIERGGRIDIDRRADALRDFGERNALGVDRAVPDSEMVH